MRFVEKEEIQEWDLLREKKRDPRMRFVEKEEIEEWYLLRKKNKNKKVYLFLGLSLFHKEHELRKKRSKNEISWEGRDPRMRPM